MRIKRSGGGGLLRTHPSLETKRDLDSREHSEQDICPKMRYLSLIRDCVFCCCYLVTIIGREEMKEEARTVSQRIRRQSAKEAL